jgi:demethylmenaquinone methyltransferase/2-methoxy-6-polyprenyl-1,4-benzoquinol methylase
MLARKDIGDLYRRRAGWYDLSANARRPSGPMPRSISSKLRPVPPEYDAVIARAAAALPAGGRLVVLDLKEPDWASQWLVTSAAWLTRPFGVTADLARRRPWEAMSRVLADFRLDDLYFGFAYVASGTVGERRDSVPNRPRVAAIHTSQGARSSHSSHSPSR